VRADDGRLDLCVYSARTPMQGAAILRRCFSGDFRPHPGLLFARGESILLESFPTAESEADGEVLVPGALHAIVEPLAACLLRGAGARLD
jgi:diacylglycerol kinase family enzyme